ncbi:54S ribosomal protein L40, mitochondrial [Wickerhamomyces ciferrii]|uniref:54S ribosomal protein L40, mitochondrial n=1 Tax=Wickerhamomyces ciferrii (strain ATCC 14091 / BCRC 22168 / CBS 111 / JCM 3599 / NBRC 0793 / NRRL Y-1031 F-60-10) TaxID=1206466 RepID=K0KP93_WICCF|nr:54S ribosomal protein L40, mitochondrial [Wickerhamomyces ciferrii]CCH42953.1 54S ribosomal protein L40, mitochondrial [Wickerhamomyces ciferrii]
MSFLSKVGERFKFDIKRLPKSLMTRYEKKYRQGQPHFMRSPFKLDLQEDNSVPKEFEKLKYLIGDRVMIIKGPKQGNICKVSRHVEGKGYILDENGPTSTVAVPKELWQDEQTSHVITFPKAVHQDNLRLIAEIDDEKTGLTKTVAVDNLKFIGKYYDEDYKKVLKYRCVAGQEDLVIPYPRPEPIEDDALSTPVDVVRERTHFIESAVRNSIPEAALLTLRNPYSKHKRTKLTKLEAKKLTPPKMPLSETKKAYLAEREELKKLPKYNITDEMKTFLGEKIREHEKVKAKQLEEAAKLSTKRFL